MEFLDIAVETASKSDRYYQHGAVLVRKKEVISKGFNDFSSHAEIRAILKGSFYKKPINKLRRYFNNCDIIVVRKNLSNSKPCKRCLESLKNYGVRRVYYSCDNKLIMEKISQMETNYLTSKYTTPWSKFSR